MSELLAQTQAEMQVVLSLTTRQMVLIIAFYAFFCCKYIFLD